MSKKRVEGCSRLCGEETAGERKGLYAQGPATDRPYEPGEHIPGLDVGGWFDAGDFDLRTQTRYAVVRNLVHAWEDFRPAGDETTVAQKRRYVEIHAPDGVPDILQQIEHGVLFLLAQFRAAAAYIYLLNAAADLVKGWGARDLPA